VIILSLFYFKNKKTNGLNQHPSSRIKEIAEEVLSSRQSKVNAKIREKFEHTFGLKKKNK
jgi:hypothetical protein